MQFFQLLPKEQWDGAAAGNHALGFLGQLLEDLQHHVVQPDLTIIFILPPIAIVPPGR